MSKFGLDISTAVVGVCMVEPIFAAWHIDLRKIDGLNAKARHVKEFLSTLVEPGDDVYIEERLMGFSHGFSNANTLMMLGQFNRVVSYVCSEITGKDPMHVHTATIKSRLKRAGLVIPPKTDRQRKKELTLEWAQRRYPNFPVEHTRTGRVKDSTYDMADAYAVAIAGSMADD